MTSSCTENGISNNTQLQFIPAYWYYFFQVHQRPMGGGKGGWVCNLLVEGRSSDAVVCLVHLCFTLYGPVSLWHPIEIAITIRFDPALTLFILYSCSPTTIRGLQIRLRLWAPPKVIMSSNHVSGAQIAVVQFSPKFCASEWSDPFRPRRLNHGRFALLWYRSG